jgi:hypothetical protein
MDDLYINKMPLQNFVLHTPPPLYALVYLRLNATARTVSPSTKIMITFTTTAINKHHNIQPTTNSHEGCY